MAILRHVTQFGNQLRVYFDDGTSYVAYKSGVLWLVKGDGGGGGPVDPGDGTMLDPFPGHYDSSDPFGNQGIRPPGSKHTGSDWNGMPAGTPIPAVSNGTIVRNEWSDGNGNTYSVAASGINPEPEFPAGTQVFWSNIHMNVAGYKPVGATITKGEIIGELGDTGYNSFGAHLHMSISDSEGINLGMGNKVDPFAFISARI